MACSHDGTPLVQAREAPAHLAVPAPSARPVAVARRAAAPAPAAIASRDFAVAPRAAASIERATAIGKPPLPQGDAGDPLIGATIHDRYRILDRVGTGGMGTVYRAVQRGLDRQVALKILQREVATDRDTATRFHREARALSRLKHSNTVRVFDFGETHDGLLFLAMELLTGEILTDRLKREGRLEVAAAVDIVRQILGSLSEAHQCGIIHRDLKPDNIYLARVEGQKESIVKVLDFGIAKLILGEGHIDQLETQAGTVFGTPRYMSPEQAQGKPLDPRSDLYTVGTLLYQLLTGQAPFTDDDAVIVMARHIKESPRPPREVAPEHPIPARLERAVMRALAKRPSDRFDDADDFDAELVRCLPRIDAQRRITARISRSLRRLPRAPLFFSALLISAALGLFAYLVAAPEAPFGLPVVGEPATAMATSGGAAEAAPTRLETIPSGAEVVSEGRVIGRTPLTIDRPRGTRLAVEIRHALQETIVVEVPIDGLPHVFTLAPRIDPALGSAAPQDPNAFEEPSADTEGGESESDDPTAEAETSPPATRSGRSRRQGRRTRRQPPPTNPAAPTGDDPYERFE